MHTAGLLSSTALPPESFGLIAQQTDRLTKSALRPRHPYGIAKDAGHKPLTCLSIAPHNKPTSRVGLAPTPTCLPGQGGRQERCGAFKRNQAGSALLMGFFWPMRIVSDIDFGLAGRPFEGQPLGGFD